MRLWSHRLLDVVILLYALGLVAGMIWYFYCGRTAIAYSVGPIYGPNQTPPLLTLALLALPWSALFHIQPIAHPNPDVWLLALEGLVNLGLLLLLRGLLSSPSAPTDPATL